MAKLREIGSVADAYKSWHRASLGIISENIQNLRERLGESPRKSTRRLSQETLFRGHQFWGFSMMTLSSFLTKFRPYGSKLIKIKRKEKHLVKIFVKGLKMTLALWIWTIWTISTTVAFVGHLPHFLSPEIWPSNIKLSFYQVHCCC